MEDRQRVEMDTVTRNPLRSHNVFSNKFSLVHHECIPEEQSYTKEYHLDLLKHFHNEIH